MNCLNGGAVAGLDRGECDYHIRMAPSVGLRSLTLSLNADLAELRSNRIYDIVDLDSAVEGC